MNHKLLDRWMNISLFVFNGAAIMFAALGYMFSGAVFGLLSEPAFAYMSWKARSWALGALTAWWTGWWFVAMWRAW